MKRFVVSCFILLAAAGSVLAQEQLAAIEGSIRDLRGSPISGATVYAYDSAHMGGRLIRVTTISLSNGKFVLDNLTPGSYSVHAYKKDEGYPDTFFAFFVANNKNAWKNAEVSEAHTAVVDLVLGPKCAKLRLSITNEAGISVSGGLSFTNDGDREPGYSTAVSDTSEVLVPAVPFRFEVSAVGYKAWRSGLLKQRSGETIKMTVRLSRSP